MAETIAYRNKGFPTFYSFLPELMAKINGEFYSFKEGNLYLHNNNNTRNNYYGEQYDTEIDYIVNKSPLERKKYKTLGLQSSHAPDIEIETDIQSDAYINKEYFEKKEDIFYSFIRNNDAQFDKRNCCGIGAFDTIDSTVLTAIVLTFTITIKEIANIGDDIYYARPTTYEPIKCGVITGVSGNTITFDSTGYALPQALDIMLAYKNSIASSQGVLGHYCRLNMTFDNTEKITIFAIETDEFKSYP
jgi:hypothetical protein